MENSLYKWKFSDDRKKWKMWYILAISIVLGLSIWGIFTGQYFFSFAVFLVTGIYLFYENNFSGDVEVKITEMWININWENFFDYSRIGSFSFVYDWENAIYLRLFLNQKWINVKVVNLFVDNKIAKDLKEILPNYIQESESSTLSFSEKLIISSKL